MNTFDTSTTRRVFLKSSGKACACAAFLPGILDGVLRSADGRLTAAAAKHLITSCNMCASVCGMKATVTDGVLTFVEGLAGDLESGGKLCAKGKSAAGFLYDPDRLKYPMKRTNPVKGIGVDPGWVKISWNEALDLATAKLKETIQKNGRDSVLVLGRPSPDTWARFVNAIGTPNRSDHVDVCYLGEKIVSGKMIGGKPWGHDFANSKYILVFGWDIVGKGKVVWARAFAEAKRKGAKIVSFNPWKSAGTSTIADESISIRPGSDLAVILAMIHVILEENLYNVEFVEGLTNFKQYETEIRAHFAPYTPEWAEVLSDVPARDIARIAREFAVTRPGICPLHKKTPTANYANGTETAFAINILNILNGSIDRPGGRFFPRGYSIPEIDAIVPPPAYPAKTGVWIDGRDKHPFLKTGGGGMFSCLADGLRRYPGKAQYCIINKYSPMGFTNPDEVSAELAKIPFTVCIDIQPNEVIDLADVVLPESIYLEASGVVGRDYHQYYPQVVVRQPVVPAQFDTKGLGAILIDWGYKAFPEYFSNPDGTKISSSYILDEKVKRAGIASSFAELKQLGLVEKKQPFVPRTKFATHDGKINIFVKDFADKGFDPLPRWTPKRDEPSSQYPFYLLTVIPPVHTRCSTENNRFLNELMPTNQVHMNPQAALGLGLAEGDMVKVRSRVGEIQLPVRLSESIRPDCVLVPHGFGHRSRLLTLAYGKGANDATLIPGQSIDEVIARRDVGGSGCVMDAVVSVAKV